MKKDAFCLHGAQSREATEVLGVTDAYLHLMFENIVHVIRQNAIPSCAGRHPSSTWSEASALAADHRLRSPEDGYARSC